MRVFALIFLAFLAFPANAKPIKIGYIDTEKVVVEWSDDEKRNGLVRLIRE